MKVANRTPQGKRNDKKKENRIKLSWRVTRSSDPEKEKL